MLKRPLARLLAAGLAIGLLVVAGQASFSTASTGGSASYVVRAGDSLWSIARRNGITMQQLAAANSMRLSDLLLIGRHLVIPGRGGAESTPSAQAASPATTTSSASSPSAGSSAATSASAAAMAYQQQNFCNVFQPSYVPVGVLPPALTAQPDRLALRPLFVQWADNYGVLPALVEAIAWQESGWQENVVSSASAVGVGQLLPSTAQFVSDQLLGLPLNINVTSDNIQMTARFLAYLAHENNDNRCRTIASYYEGMGLLDGYGVIPETQAYVASVEALIPRFE